MCGVDVLDKGCGGIHVQVRVVVGSMFRYTVMFRYM